MITTIRIVGAFLFLSFYHISFCQSELSIEEEIDSIVFNAISEEAFPGCVIYATKGEDILFFKSYGFHTYDSLRRVAINDIYDLASITKATGATLAIMKLFEEGMIDLDDPIGKHIEGLGQKVGESTFRECLAHQAGLKPWIPFYLEVKKKNGKFKNKTFSTEREGFSYALNDSLYLYDDFYRRIKRMIRKTRVSEKVYKYSGLFFYLVPELVKNLTGSSYDQFLYENFYDSLGAKTLMFNPLDEFDSAQIVPTEDDTYFRMLQIHGTVHDEGAITMKGVSGNAGLFGNAEDLSKVWKMLLKNGVYDSIKYLKPETIQLFTTAQYPNNNNRRGLGFDKPLLEYDSIQSSVARDTSFKSYGHSGYTGTLVWADPENDLLFIFLTNRVYPSRENRNIYNLNVRPRIHQLIYDELKMNSTYQLD